ncbi:MAG TPA: glycosyltransferase family 4 protein [Candidatus Limnocylindrales bacterium]
MTVTAHPPITVIVAHNRYRSASPSGENLVVDQEIEQLVAAGLRVVPFLRHSDRIPALPLGQKLLLPLAPIRAGAAQRDLAELIARHRPDVVHLHNPYPLLSPWVVRTAQGRGVPVVQTVHNYRHVCVSGLYFRDGMVCRDCRVDPTAAIRHACYRGSRAQSAIMAVALQIHAGTWRGVDRFIAPTSAIQNHLRGYGISADRIVIKPNSVADPGDPPPEPGHGVLFAGRPSPEKGIDLLVEACLRAGVPLRIAGGVHPTAGGLGILSPGETRAAIRQSAIVAVPSLMEDVFPTVAIEALANGRPIIGTPFGGIPEIVGNAGWIVPPTVDAWASALPDAICQANSLSGAARERYLRLFSPARVTDQLIGVYAGLGKRGADRENQAHQ